MIEIYFYYLKISAVFGAVLLHYTFNLLSNWLIGAFIPTTKRKITVKMLFVASLFISVGCTFILIAPILVVAIYGKKTSAIHH